MSKENKLTVSASPHIVSPVTTNSIMFDVIIALLPACFGGVYFFGFRSAILILCSVLFCVLAEEMCIRDSFFCIRVVSAGCSGG